MNGSIPETAIEKEAMVAIKKSLDQWARRGVRLPVSDIITDVMHAISPYLRKS